MRPYKKKRELADWIRRRLGSPFTKVMIDTTQIDDCIDQACDFFGEFAGGVGNVDSIVLINPELVYYDGTGKESQPGPKKGKWRSPLPPFLQSLTVDQINALTVDQYNALRINCGSTPAPTSVGTSSCCPSTYNSTKDKYGGDDGDPNTNYQIDSDCCPTESAGPGPGWCGDGIQPAHCFTETLAGDPLAIGPYWVEGDTTAKPSGPNRYIFKTVYDIPSDVIAINERLTMGMFGLGSNNEDNALFSPIAQMMQAGGSWGMQSAGQSMDSRYGFWMGGSGGFVDIVGLQLGLSYIEMFRQMFTVKMNVQLLELEHKVILTPPPTSKGVIALAVTRKVADESMFGHIWVRQYSLAKTMQDIGMNAGKYSNMLFPGGGSINSEQYLKRGDELAEKLEKQLTESHDFTLPCDFFVRLNDFCSMKIGRYLI